MENAEFLFFRNSNLFPNNALGRKSERKKYIGKSAGLHILFLEAII